MKNFTISIFAIIGFVTILSSFNNQSETQSEVGTYQISNTYRENGNWIFETIIDTRTGEVISRERKRGYSAYNAD